ncbi:MAG: ABC transporter permease, partial [Chloroflexota bacterium]|nr:ABC transporter permease [Chloroflexota bacterium]
MKLLDIIRMALFSLGVNKLRSGLALLGIVIGVTAVITLMSIGKGVQDSITSRLESLGTNLIFVMPGEETDGKLTLGDVLALQSEPNAKSIGGV